MKLAFLFATILPFILGILFFSVGPVEAWYSQAARYVTPSCAYGSTQARVQRDTSDPWKASMTINPGDGFNVGGFHDGTGQWANDVTNWVSGPGINRSAGNGERITNLQTGGTYTVYVTTNGQAGGNCVDMARVNVGTAYQNAPSPTTPSAPTSAKVITIQNFAFTPQTFTVSTGTTITWINYDSTAHQVISDDGGSSFAGPVLQPNQSYSFTFNSPGTFAYHCNIHPNMKANIIVTSSTVGSSVQSNSATVYDRNTSMNISVRKYYQSSTNPSVSTPITQNYPTRYCPGTTQWEMDNIYYNKPCPPPGAPLIL